MNIIVEGDIPESSSISISCCGKTKVIDTIDRSIAFNVSKTENLILEIEEKTSKCNHSLYGILIFIITAVIQGLFNILLMNDDKMWYQNVRAYNTKVFIPINENNDLLIKFKLYDPKYIGTGIIWEVPKFCLEPQRHFDIIYEKNPLEISNVFFDHLKKVISVSLVIFLIFTILLISTFEYNFIFKYIMIVLLSLLIITTSAIIIKEYKRYKKLINTFVSNE